MNKASTLFVFAALLVPMALLLAALLYLDVHRYVLQLLEWIDGQGFVAQLVFVLVMALVVILNLPGVFFTLGAGFIFGLVKGVLYVVIGTTLGAIIAFLIARYLFSDRIRVWLYRYPRLQFIDDECASEGWKIILLTRLIPFFPFKLSNYFFGLSRFALKDFFWATAVGIIPYSLHNVYLGSITASLARLGTSEALTAVQWLFYGLGFVCTVLAVIYFRRLAARIAKTLPVNPAGGKLVSQATAAVSPDNYGAKK